MWITSRSTVYDILYTERKEAALLYRIGLIVNPIAGLGGPAAQKGSDAPDIRAVAAAAGILPSAGEKVRRCLAQLAAQLGRAGEACEVVTGPGELGADISSGIFPTLTLGEGHDDGAPTTAADTRMLAGRILDSHVDLLLFAGGDGTARDILDSVGAYVPVVGIPAGAKIYSAVFALSPVVAGSLAAAWLLAGGREAVEREVVDVDESELRAGRAVPALYGNVLVPVDPGRLQERKRASPAADANAMRSLAIAYIRRMKADELYLLGPGGTTYAIGAELGLDVTRLGVDVIKGGKLVARDADAGTLDAIVGPGTATAVLTPLGGHGFLIGRGNQQLTPKVLRRCRLDVVATPGKLASLGARPLRVDSGDDEFDAGLNGFTRIFTGPGAESMYPIRNTQEES